jgi:hypothetical protein
VSPGTSVGGYSTAGLRGPSSPTPSEGPFEVVAAAPGGKIQEGECGLNILTHGRLQPTTVPGLALSAPSALEGAVYGLQLPLTAMPPGPPTASCSPDGQLCDSVVVFEGLGSLSLLQLPWAGLSLRCPFLLVQCHWP